MPGLDNISADAQLRMLEEKAAALQARAEAVKSKRLELENRMAAAAIRVRKAEDYRQIMNLMSAHVHCSLNQDYETELERYWSERDDIVYANGDMACVGRKAVYDYYVNSAKARAAEARGIIKDVYGTEPEGDKAPGYKNMNLIGTPYIEIAEDGQTAQGIWMAHSFNGQLDKDGKIQSQGVLSRYSGEFILENGKWKIWRRRNYADVVFEEKSSSMFGPPPTADGKPPKPMVENPLPTSITRIKAGGGMYTPETVPDGAPPIPEPYDTWTYETSNVRKEAD